MLSVVDLKCVVLCVSAIMIRHKVGRDQELQQCLVLASHMYLEISYSSVSYCLSITKIT
jgi:hypothetical protein